MGKIFIWLGVFAAIYIAIKFVGIIRRKNQLDEAESNSETPSGTDPKSNQESSKRLADLISCKKCGVHLPRGEAVQRGQNYFCSEDHAG